MSTILPKDRVSLCRYTFSDHRQCRTPRSPHHPHFCFYHARLESQSAASSQLADDIAYFFSGEYISANDLARVLARLLPAMIRGDIKPRLAKTIVYLAQTLNQTIHLAQHEYINAYGTNAWRRTIQSSVTQNSNRDEPPTQDKVAANPEENRENNSADNAGTGENTECNSSANPNSNHSLENQTCPPDQSEDSASSDEAESEPELLPTPL